MEISLEDVRHALVELGRLRFGEMGLDWLPAGVKPVISCPSVVVRRVLQASGIGAFCELAL